MTSAADATQQSLIPGVPEGAARAPLARRGRNGGGNANGNANSVRPEDAAVHRWYRFVLSFPPHLVARYIDQFGLGADNLLLDPFCGTGTTLVEGKKRGIPTVGVEALPTTAFAARVKVDWVCSPDALEHHAAAVAASAHDRLSRRGISDLPVNDAVDAGDLLGLGDGQRKVLLANSISPLPLHKTLVLLQEIEHHADADEVAEHERLALAATVIESVSNLKFGPEVGVGKTKRDAEVIGPWQQKIRGIAADLRAVTDRGTESTVVPGDAREVGALLDADSVDAVITSPPYPNEKDYTRTVRLESVLLGFIGGRRELREVKDGLLRSNTRNVFAGDSDRELVQDCAEVIGLMRQIESRRIELGKDSGFERNYARVTGEYFGGMRRHLRSLRRVLKPGARLAYVVGDQASYFRVLIRTGEVLATIAEREGYEVVGNDLFRTRKSTVTGDDLREEVLLLRVPARSAPRSVGRSNAPRARHVPPSDITAKDLRAYEHLTHTTAP